jgi:glycosyltransferase involved in cell wall biosynthesis
MKSTPTLSIIIPCYQESGHLTIVLEEILSHVKSLTITHELVVVDDGSQDNTWEVLQELSLTYPTLVALRLSRNFGKEYSIYAGLEICRGQAAIVIDGDLQHPPYLIPEMVRLWKELNVEVVEAVKISRAKESWINKLGARLFYSMLSSFSSYNLRGASDYKLLDRKVIDALLKMEERNLFFRGMVAWLGFRHIQIPFKTQERIAGVSGWSISKLIRLAINGVTSFSSLPLHIVTLFGFIFLAFAFALGIQTLIFKFSGRAIDGFATVILLLLIIGSLLMISLGIIGEYIAKIYEEIKGRPRYIVMDKIDEKLKEK